MAGGRAARGRPRGGEDIPAQAASRTRLAAAAAAAAALLGLAAWPVAVDARPRPLLVLLGTVAALLQLAGLAGSLPALVPWSIGTLMASYTLGLLWRGGGVDASAPLYGGGLLLAAELSYWSIELRRIRALPGPVGRRRAAVVAALVLAGIALAATSALVAGPLPVRSTLLLRAVAVVAAVATVATVAGLARRGRAQR